MENQESKLNSSFGIMNVSTLNSNPLHSFGTAPRDNLDKLFINKELAKTQLTGKQSAGPKYAYDDKYCFKEGPRATIGNEQRKNLNETDIYEHFNNQDELQVVKADYTRKPECQKTKFNQEKRFIEKKRPQTPGPKYNVPLKPEIPNSNKYSFGNKFDLPGQTVVRPLISTPQEVGPGSYNQKPDTSLQITKPKYSFTKDSKEPKKNPSLSINQTYEIRSSLGNQKTSKKTTEPQINFAKSKRYARVGSFKQQMQVQPVRVNIPMPKY